MLGHGPLGSAPLGSFAFAEQVLGSRSPTISISGLIVPEKKVSEGILLKSYSALWLEVAARLGSDWSIATQFNASQWEEIVAGAFEKDGYQVILTPRSGDYGRDIIATKDGVGSIRILGSVKAYKPGNLVTHEAVRSLMGVIGADQKASKGILTTTSDFAPTVKADPLIAPYLPTRIELVNGAGLQKWLADLVAT